MRSSACARRDRLTRAHLAAAAAAAAVRSSNSSSSGGSGGCLHDGCRTGRGWGCSLTPASSKGFVASFPGGGREEIDTRPAGVLPILRLPLLSILRTSSAAPIIAAIAHARLVDPFLHGDDKVLYYARPRGRPGFDNRRASLVGHFLALSHWDSDGDGRRCVKHSRATWGLGKTMPFQRLAARRSIEKKIPERSEEEK